MVLCRATPRIAAGHRVTSWRVDREDQIGKADEPRVSRDMSGADQGIATCIGSGTPTRVRWGTRHEFRRYDEVSICTLRV